MSQILGAVIPAPRVLAPIPEEGDLTDTTMPETAESGTETRPRQPESEPRSEPVDRNVRPRLAPDQEVTQLDEVENSQSTTQARGPDTRRSSCGQSACCSLLDTLSVSVDIRQQLLDSASD